MTTRTWRRGWWRGIVLAGLALLAAPVSAIAQQPGVGMDLSQASGVPLPAADLPAGTVTVRVVRESFANNLSGIDVVFTVGGSRSTVTTDASGRAAVAGVPSGTPVQAEAVVDGERLTTRSATVGTTGGLRFILVAGLASANPAAAPVAGGVTFGSSGRIIADFADERLNIYYLLPIVNPASTPVDPGGPFIIDLPQGARTATVLESSTASATANGARITVRGPYPPGTSSVEVAYELPTSGGTARLEQAWPEPIDQLTFFLLQQDGFDLSSAQFSSTQTSTEQGQSLVVGAIPALAAGDPLVVEISGLPFHPTWPRNTALVLGGALMLLGIWGALTPNRGRRAA